MLKLSKSESHCKRQPMKPLAPPSESNKKRLDLKTSGSRKKTGKSSRRMKEEELSMRNKLRRRMTESENRTDKLIYSTESKKKSVNKTSLFAKKTSASKENMT